MSEDEEYPVVMTTGAGQMFSKKDVENGSARRYLAEL